MAATTDYAPLRPSDPAWIDSYALVGRLTEDARADIYVARDAAGALVEVAWATAETELGAEAGTLSRVSASSLAQVTALGRWAGRPYLVSEHVAGEPLRAVIARDGPWSGPRLHRLAVAMVTALVALHQAGVTHGDLHPGTVTHGRDGIRVTGYGLVGPTDAAGATPAGDLHDWATTLLFAATGSDAVDVDALDEHLREIVAACLDKEPARRPDAGEVLLRLVGHSPLTIAPRQSATRGPARTRLAIGAGALLLAVAGAGGGYLLARSTQPAPPVAAATVPNLSASPSLATQPPMATATVTAPLGKITLVENPADPTRFVAMRDDSGAWVRTASGFVSVGKAEDVAASRDGTWAALRKGDLLFLLNRTDGSTHQVSVPTGVRPAFDQAGKTVLLTLGTGERPTGFALVDVATRTVRNVPTREASIGLFTWAPDGASVMISYPTQQGHGVRVHDLNGKELRSMPWVGELAGRNPASPSGRLFMTFCPSGGTWCAWDATTGARRSVLVNTVKDAEWWGWWDDDHVLVYHPDQNPRQVRVLDFHGRSSRVAMTIPKAADGPDLLISRAAR